MFAHTYNIITYRGVGELGHGIKFVCGLNSNDKQFLSILMKTVQLTGAEHYDSHMEIYTSTANTDIGSVREFQKKSYPTKSHGLLEYSSNLKWYESEYHVQDSKYVPHTSIKMPCTTTQVPALSFCGPHAKPHGVRGLRKSYHLVLDPKLGHGKYSMQRITCACI